MKCIICDTDSGMEDICPECEQRIEALKNSLRNMKYRVSKVGLTRAEGIRRFAG